MASRQPVAKGGMFGASTQRPLSSQTKDLLKVMMEESRLSMFQRRKLNETVDRGASLPVRVAPTCSEPISQPHIVLPPRKAFNMVGSRPSSMRSRKDLEESGAYERPQFVPKPVRSLDVEKERLSNIMAFGEDVKPKTREQLLKDLRAKEEQNKAATVDRFDEIQSEIEERKHFLANMEKIGQGKEYRAIIATQISGLIREMELIDKKRTEDLVKALMEEEDRTEAKR